MAERCTGTKNDGTPCRAWAAQGSDPPRCPAHADQPADPIEPAEGDIAMLDLALLTAAAPTTIDQIIDGLAGWQAVVSYLIEQSLQAAQRRGAILDLGRLFGIYSLNAVRLTQLLRAQVALSGSGDAMEEALDQALDALANDLGVKL
jgi:hypothetical protein